MDTDKELARVLKALSDPTRFHLVRLLAEQGEGGALCVGALGHRLGVSQSAVSQHLAVLRGVGLVVDERRGYFVHYRVDRSRIAATLAQVQTMLVDVHNTPACAEHNPGSSCQCSGAGAGEEEE